MWPRENTTKSGHLDKPLKEKQLRNEAIAIEKEKCIKNLNKPIYVGASILDLSKVSMQGFQYNYVKSKYVDKCYW